MGPISATHMGPIWGVQPGSAWVDKNGAIWCNLGIPKYAITKLKISNFKVNKSTTTKVNCHIFFPEVNLVVHI